MQWWSQDMSALSSIRRRNGASLQKTKEQHLAYPSDTALVKKAAYSYSNLALDILVLSIFLWHFSSIPGAQKKTQPAPGAGGVRGMPESDELMKPISGNFSFAG